VGSVDCLEIERQGWQALSTSGAAATTYYGRILDSDVVMLLPGGMVLDDRTSIIEAMSGQPWASFELADLRALHPLPDTCVVTYAVVASRQGSPAYSALVSSLYVRREDGWRLAFHQQTPR
jgi:hypothetical protein